jgi:CRP-like cAMP-binding protein
LTAPAAVNVEEVLQGVPLRTTIRAIEHSIGFRVPAPVFLTMVSDNILMAQSLFRLLLGRSPYRLRASIVSPSQAVAMRSGSGGSERLFPPDPLLAGATAAQLLAMRASASNVTLTPGAIVFDLDAPPAIFSILEGELRLESPDQPPILASAGAMFGVADTLAGTPSGWRAVVSAQGRALRLDRDDLFGVMADHVDLMQNLFIEALRLRDRDTSEPVARAEQQFFA